MRLIVCNYCEEIILETHKFTIKDGTIYHWSCLKEVEDNEKFAREFFRTTPRRPVKVEPIDGEIRHTYVDGRVEIEPHSELTERRSGDIKKPVEQDILNRAPTIWDKIFRRKK